MWARGYVWATVGSVTEEIIKRYIESQELSNKEDKYKTRRRLKNYILK